MFKSISLYRLTGNASLTEALQATEALQFVPTGPTQASSIGLVPPREEHGALIEQIGGAWIFAVMIERRTVPTATLKKRVDELAEQVEKSTGRKPGKKARSELKDQATLELLPQAFPKQTKVLVWLDVSTSLIAVDATTGTKVDPAIMLVQRALGDVAIAPVHTQQSPSAVMTGWLIDGATIPMELTLGRACELKQRDETKATVRYARAPLDTDEVRQHCLQGMRATRLEVQHQAGVEFTLDDQGRMRGIEILVDAKVQETDHADEFDASVAILTGMLAPVVRDLIAALGGEVLPTEGGEA